MPTPDTFEEKKEEWKPVVGYEGIYEVSSMGRIKSAPRLKTKGGILKPAHCRGYEIVCLYNNGKKETNQVHRIVAKAFIPNKDYSLQVNHIDHNRKNNNVNNLEWCTQKVNMRKAYHHNDGYFGDKNHNHTIKESYLKDIWKRIKNGELLGSIAKSYNVTYTCIYCIKTGRTWSKRSPNSERLI